MPSRFIHMRQPYLGYGIAALAVMGATALRLLLDPLLHNQVPFATYFLAVALTACFAEGWGPSLAALVLGFLTADYCFVEPRGTFSFNGLPMLAASAVYFFVGAMLVVLAQGQRRSREAAAASLSLAVITEEKLRKEIIQRMQAEQQAQDSANGLETRVAERTRQIQSAHEDLVAQMAERERTEQALIRSRDLLGHIINSIPQYVFWKDRNLNYLGCNTLFARAAGLATANEIIGRNDFDLSWKDMAERYRADDRLVIETQTAKLNFEEPLGGPEGHGRIIRTSKVPLLDPDGAALGILGVFEDITERKRTQEALAQSEARQRLIISSAPIVLYSAYPRGSYGGTWVSDNIKAITGYSPRQFVEEPDLWMSRLHPDDREAALAAARHAAESGFGSAEYRWQCADGRYRWLLDQSVLVRHPGGNDELIGMWLDVTERKQAEALLQQAQERLELALRAGNVGLWSWDLATNSVYYSAIWKSQLGYAGHEITDTFEEWSSRLHPEDRDRAVRDATAFARGETDDYRIEFRMRHKDGAYRWILVQADIQRDEHGDPLVVTGCHIDITERKQAESWLRESEERFRLLTHSTKDGIVLADEAGIVVFVNKGAEGLFGYPEAEILGKPLTLLMPERYREAHGRGIARMKRTGESRVIGKTVELQGLRKDGTEFPIDLTVGTWEQGGRRFYGGIIRDITERKRMEAQAGELERLNMAGQLADGIAHEMKNPLFILSGRIQLLKEKLLHREYATVAEDLAKIESATARMADIADRFGKLVKRPEGVLQPTLIQEILKQVLELLAPDLTKDHISVKTAMATDLPPIQAAPWPLQKAFMNLITNAEQAMVTAHGKGSLSITAALVADEITEQAAEGKTGDRTNWIEVRIEDDGPGIPPEIRSKLFEPFVTTKPSGEGSGLGLWIVRSTLMALGGSVQVESESGRGAAFIVRLPLAAAPASVAS